MNSNPDNTDNKGAKEIPKPKNTDFPPEGIKTRMLFLGKIVEELVSRHSSSSPFAKQIQLSRTSGLQVDYGLVKKAIEAAVKALLEKSPNGIIAGEPSGFYSKYLQEGALIDAILSEQQIEMVLSEYLDSIEIEKEYPSPTGWREKLRQLF